MSSRDRSVLTLAALIVALLVGMVAGKELLAPPQYAESKKKENAQQVRIINLEDQPGTSGLAAIGSVIVGALALFFAHRKTVIAEKSRVDPLVQAQHKLEAETITDLLREMRKCLSTAESYSEMAQTHLKPGKPAPPRGGQKVTEQKEKLLHARKILNTVELEAETTLPAELVTAVADFRDQISGMLRNEFEVSKRGDEMLEELHSKYSDFREEARSSLKPDEIRRRSPLEK